MGFNYKPGREIIVTQKILINQKASKPINFLQEKLFCFHKPINGKTYNKHHVVQERSPAG